MPSVYRQHHPEFVSKYFEKKHQLEGKDCANLIFVINKEEYLELF